VIAAAVSWGACLVVIAGAVAVLATVLALAILDRRADDR
jgi:hypothetical protein